MIAAALAALAGVFYTLLAGAEVPTVRSCIAALVVLAGLTLGRQVLSLRIVAFAILLLRPETLRGPSFQLSFGAVRAIVALY
jgi:competence protein ComEC